MKKRIGDIVLVTSNPQKAKEIAFALRPYQIRVRRRAVDIREIQADALETVIKNKVEQAYALVRRPVIVDDAGMFFVGYRHFPGVYSRFVFMSLGFAGLFKLIQPGQLAYFASFIAYKASASEPARLFSGRCRGKLTKHIKGQLKRKMPYDNFFIPNGDTRTFAQMTVEDKQKYDHRSQAIRKFARFLTQSTK